MDESNNIIYGKVLPTIYSSKTYHKLSQAKLSGHQMQGNFIGYSTTRVNEVIRQDAQTFWPGVKIELKPGGMTNHKIVAVLAQRKLLGHCNYNETSNTYIGKNTISLDTSTGLFLGALARKLIQDSGGFAAEKRLLSHFTKPAASYSRKMAERRQGKLRERFKLHYPHNRWVKFHTLGSLDETRRLEIAYHIAVNVWQLINTEELYHTRCGHRYKTREDYDNIAAYVATDMTPYGIVYNDLIPIPRESYHELLIDIDKVFKIMGKPFSPASSALMAMEVLLV